MGDRYLFRTCLMKYEADVTRLELKTFFTIELQWCHDSIRTDHLSYTE